MVGNLLDWELFHLLGHHQQRPSLHHALFTDCGHFLGLWLNTVARSLAIYALGRDRIEQFGFDREVVSGTHLRRLCTRHESLDGYLIPVIIPVLGSSKKS